MLGRACVEACGLRIRFWEFTVDGQYNAVNLGLWSRVTQWAGAAKPGKYPSQAGQVKVCEGCEDGILLELNPWNVITMRPGRDNRLGNVLCSRTHAFALSWAHNGVDLPVQYAAAWSMLSTSSLGNSRMSCWGWQLPLRYRRELKGAHEYMESSCKFSPSGMVHAHFFAKTCPGKWSFEVSRSEGRG